MASYWLRSKNIVTGLKPKIGSLLCTIDHTFASQSPDHIHRYHRKADTISVLKVPKTYFPCSNRFKSTKAAGNQSAFSSNDTQVLDFPGGKVNFSSEMKFIPESSSERICCYRILDENGRLMNRNFIQISQEFAVKMYINMVTLQVMDTVFYDAQRQGRISFYATSIGEEAINIASAAALNSDDLIFPQYREPGILLWRGFTLEEFANQCCGNTADYGKGRQMPVHYGSNKLNYFTVASTIATQIPHAVGAAYALKMNGTEACAVTYFGDGGTSENELLSLQTPGLDLVGILIRLNHEPLIGSCWYADSAESRAIELAIQALCNIRNNSPFAGDFHAGLNFAAVMEAPVIFFCRNNGWAISTPISDQFRSDGVVVRGQAYGVRSIRVDGNDALAVFTAVQAAREMAVKEKRPVLIEALTYRVGHHSTSDDSTKYRQADEIERWRGSGNPVARFKKWIQGNGWWGNEDESELQTTVRNQLVQALQVAEKMEKPEIKYLFTDVYDETPSNLREQEKALRETIYRHPKDYPIDIPF